MQSSRGSVRNPIYWNVGDIAAARELADAREFSDQQAARATTLEDRLARMTTLAEGLATLQPAPTTTTGALRPRPMEVASLGAFMGVSSDIKCFQNAAINDEQHRLRYCFSFLKGDAYTTIGAKPAWTSRARRTSPRSLRVFGNSREQDTAAS